MFTVDDVAVARTDQSIHGILRAAAGMVDPEVVRNLQRSADADRARQRETRMRSAGTPLTVKVVDGSPIADLLRVVAAAVRAGRRVEVSMQKPLSEALHRAFIRSETTVRVESLDRWSARWAADGGEVRVLGAAAARKGAVMRATSLAGHTRASMIDSTPVRHGGAAEFDALIERTEFAPAA